MGTQQLGYLSRQWLFNDSVLAYRWPCNFKIGVQPAVCKLPWSA